MNQSHNQSRAEGISILCFTLNQQIIMVNKVKVGFLLISENKQELLIRQEQGNFFSDNYAIYYVLNDVINQIELDPTGNFHMKRIEPKGEWYRYFPNSNVKQLKWKRCEDTTAIWVKNEIVLIKEKSISKKEINGSICFVEMNKKNLVIVYLTSEKEYKFIICDYEMNELADDKLTKEKINSVVLIKNQLIIAIEDWPTSKLIYINLQTFVRNEEHYPSYIHSLATVNRQLYLLISNLTQKPKIEIYKNEKRIKNPFQVIEMNHNKSFYFNKKDKKELIIFLHGGPIGCWRDLYNPIIESMVTLNKELVLINFSGSNTGIHEKNYKGKDYGRTDLNELTKLISIYRSKYEKIFLVGESYGGYLTWLYLNSYEKTEVDGAIILNGFLSPNHLLNKNPAIDVLKRILPIPQIKPLNHLSILYIGARYDQLINVIEIEEELKQLNQQSIIVNSQHNINNPEHIQLISSAMHTFLGG